MRRWTPIAGAGHETGPTPRDHSPCRPPPCLGQVGQRKSISRPQGRARPAAPCPRYSPWALLKRLAGSPRHFGAPSAQLEGVMHFAWAVWLHFSAWNLRRLWCVSRFHSAPGLLVNRSLRRKIVRHRPPCNTVTDHITKTVEHLTEFYFPYNWFISNDFVMKRIVIYLKVFIMKILLCILLFIFVNIFAVYLKSMLIFSIIYLLSLALLAIYAHNNISFDGIHNALHQSSKKKFGKQ